MINLDLFKIYTFNDCKKIRLGSNNDGGYVIIENIGSYDFLISGGAGSNTTFEKCLTEKYKIFGLIVDDKANTLPHSNTYLTLIKCTIDKINNLVNYFENYKDIFLKIDIEGFEYDLFSNWTDQDFLRIKQMVIEFHYPYSESKMEILKKIIKNHTILHFHANNCCGCININDISMPKVFEITAVRNDTFLDKQITQSSVNLPTEIDQKNVVKNPDIILDYPPFIL